MKIPTRNVGRRSISAYGRTTMSESGAAGEKGFQRTRRTESAVEYVYDTDIRLRLYERAQAGTLV